MKKILIVAAAIAAGSIGTANAQTVNQQIDINALVNSKCGISAQQTVVTLGDMTDAQARVRAAVTQEIADGLNAARVVAFCNAPNSTVNVTRAVMARVGSTGNQLTTGGFAQFVRYNLDASIDGLALDSTTTPGGNTVAERFGGHISLSDSRTHIRFVPAVSQGTAVATSGGPTPTDATGWSSLTDRRLAAGDYVGFVNVTLTPGA